MKKEVYIEKLEKVTGYDNNKCIIINSILEDHFIVGKRNKEKIINDFKEKLDINDLEAEEIYNKAVKILGNGLKDKIKHPFKSQD